MAPPRFGLTHVGDLPEDLAHIRDSYPPSVWITHNCSHEGIKKDGQVLGVLPIGPEGWTVQTVFPLTVHPSIQCVGCEFHGFIIDGEWYPA